MKKSSLLFAALALVSASAFGAELKLTVRSDYMNTQKHKNTSDKDVDGASVFFPSAVKLSMAGKVGTADVKAALNLASAGSIIGGDTTANTFPIYSVTTPSSLVNYLYISKAHGDMTFTAGKIESLLGGFEADQYNAGWNYMPTLAAGFMGANEAAALGGPTVVATPGNNSGVGFSYKLPTGALSFQVFNQSGATDASIKTTTGTITSANFKRHNYGLHYLGDYGSFKVNFAYYLGATATSAYSSAAGSVGGTESNETYVNLGVSGSAGDFSYTAEYFDNTSKGTLDTDKKNQTNTIYGQIAYKTGMYVPLARIESSYHKALEDDAGAGSFKRTGLALGLQIHPTDDAFEYHVIYGSASDAHGLSSLANTKVNFQTLIVGLKYTGDLLK